MTAVRYRMWLLAPALALGLSVHASPPMDEAPIPATPAFRKGIDRPSERDLARTRAMRAVIEAGDAPARTGAPVPEGRVLADRGRSLAKAGADRVLVILVEFDPAAEDSFVWTPGVSTWDPFGRCDASEWTGDASDIGNAAASIRVAQVNSVTGPKTFTYSGPAHNQITRPYSASSANGNMVWTPDFSPQWYNDLIFGDGIRFQYTRQDGSTVNQDFTGSSVRRYYQDLSGGLFDITGTVVGWVKVPHSLYWYGADPCPGAQSGIRTPTDGGIPGAGSARSLVIDAIEAVKKAYPAFDWKSYDQDHDGVIDRLWIIHAGLGEEEATSRLALTPYGEGTIWSHSAGLAPAYPVVSDGTSTLYAGSYIMMPENCGIAVLAHEFGHNIGAADLYAYGTGNTSAGFWTLMSDSWTGYPIGFLPTYMDPWHLDNWGWLSPAVVSDPQRIYKLSLGQASKFPGAAGTVRGARLPLPDGHSPLPVRPSGAYQWWGGQQDVANAMMTLASPIAIPAGGATLQVNLAWDIERSYDFLWVQASADGTNWTTLANADTTTLHDAAWIGALYGFPSDLAAAGIGGFSGRSAAWPAYTWESFNLNAFAGKSIRLRLWYMTDWGATGAGAYVDGVKVTSGTTTLFNSQASPSSTTWSFAAPWSVNDGTIAFSHSYYLQWRNVSATGGYDRCLGDPLWRYGPANTGLLVWYNNGMYNDNEVGSHLTDFPGFGPKGRMLAVDAHPEPYRYADWVSAGYNLEAVNLYSRGLMRDAPFSLDRSVDFAYGGASYAGYPAVSEFHDSQGYYPGAEYVSCGPAYDPPVTNWLTKQWDASVVLPSKVAYGIKAPGLGASDSLYYGSWINYDGTVGAFRIAGLGYAGGTGNPGDAGGAYGWNAKILDQSPAGATVVVWNTSAAAVVPAADVLPRAAGSALSVPAPGVLANDAGPQGWADVASAELVSGAAHGTVSLLPSGALTYTPAAGYAGLDAFTYRVRTAYGAVSAAATVTVAPRGDVNLDGVVNAADARLALRMAGGLLKAGAPGACMATANVDGDAAVTLADAGRIVRIAAGK